MTIESASSGKTTSLGLVEDHPVRIGPIMVFLQIQVVDSAPFEVLLGRPFFDITSCTAVVTNGCVKSLVRGSHVDTESGGRIGHIEDGESVAGSVGGLWAG